MQIIIMMSDDTYLSLSRLGDIFPTLLLISYLYQSLHNSFLSCPNLMMMMIVPNSHARKGGGEDWRNERGVWKNLRGGGNEC